MSIPISISSTTCRWDPARQVSPPSSRTCRPMRPSIRSASLKMGTMSSLTRSTADSPGPLYDSFQWGSDTAIYAINNEISSFDFYVLTVNHGGVAQSQDYQSEFATFYVRMHYDSGTGLVYTDDGYVINPANGQSVDAFQASGYMVPDSTLNTAFFLGQTQ